MQALIEILGNATRSQILHELCADRLTSIELARRVGANHSSVYRHLVRLEQHGFVTADLPASERSGRSVRWAADTAAIRSAGQQWLDFITGRSSTPPS